jgi:hypothetical protein
MSYVENWAAAKLLKRTKPFCRDVEMDYSSIYSLIVSFKTTLNGGRAQLRLAGNDQRYNRRKDPLRRILDYRK